MDFFHTDACSIPVKSLEFVKQLQNFLFQEEKCYGIIHFSFASVSW